MLLDEIKSKELEELLADAFRLGVETAQRLMESPSDDVRLGAICALAKLVKHCGPVLHINRAAVMVANQVVVERPVTERDVNQLLDDVMGNEEEKEEEEEEEVQEAPPKPAAKIVAQEKPSAVPPRPKAKPIIADEDEAPRVNRKYLVALGALAAVFMIYFFWPSGIVTPAGLASTALSARDAETRRVAAVDLCLLADRNDLPQLRRVRDESKDPEVTAVVVERIFRLARPEDIGAHYALLESPDEKVRMAAAAGFAAIYGDSVPDGLVYDPKGPAEERSRVARALKAKFDAVQKKAMDDLNNSK